jgi:hypothetical protein
MFFCPLEGHGIVAIEILAVLGATHHFGHVPPVSGCMSGVSSIAYQD